MRSTLLLALLKKYLELSLKIFSPGSGIAIAGEPREHRRGSLLEGFLLSQPVLPSQRVGLAHQPKQKFSLVSNS